MKLLLQKHALDALGTAASNTVAGRRAFVVTDANVAPLYLGRAAWLVEPLAKVVGREM